MFGLASFVLASEVVRGFGTWFFQRKCELLEFEIKRSGKHPSLWEKKGASLYTVTNVTRRAKLRKFTNRLFNKIEALGGFVFYVGLKKTAEPRAHNSNRLYARVFLEAIKRIDGFCEEDCDPPGNFILILDEHDQRSALITAAARSMYARTERRRSIWKATAIRHSRQRIGLLDWWDALGRSGPPASPRGVVRLSSDDLAQGAARNRPNATRWMRRCALEAKAARLEHELHTAHTILDVQGKVAGLVCLNGSALSAPERPRRRRSDR